MRKFLRRFWPVLILLLLIIGAAAVNLGIGLRNREPPNWSKMEDGLYLGGRVLEPPPGTDAVLNLNEIEDPYRAETHRWEPIRDSAPAPSIDWLREQVEFVEAERAAGKTVYVHCTAGVSRGAMVVVAYYMAHMGWTRDEALAFVKERRSIIRPNKAFMELLLVWEHVLQTKASAAFLGHRSIVGPPPRLVICLDHRLQTLSW
jgi:hypothetical protein